MRGQWDNYDSFNLIELIDEIKIRIKEPFRVDDVIHGALIVGKDYDGLCKELRDFLVRDDDEELKTIAERLKNDDGTPFNFKNVITIRSLGQITSMIRCSNCKFDIYVHPNQDKVVCEHCDTVNDLRLSNLINGGSASNQQIDFNKVRDEWRDNR